MRHLKLLFLLFLFAWPAEVFSQVPARSTPITCVRDDALSTVPQAEGQQVPCRVDADGRVWVNVGIVAVTGPLTDAELRATAVPVSGTFWQATQPVSGTFWQATQPVSGTVTVTDGAGALNVIVDSLPTVTVTDGAGALNVIVDSSALPSGAATSANQDGIVRDGAGDTTQANVSSGRLHVDGSGVTQPVSGTVTVTDGAGALNVICDSGCAGGTQHAVDTALGATPTGTLAIGIRDDALSTLTPVEGDAIGLRVNSRGALWIDLETRLDQTNDAITIYGSDDAGTTKRIVKTDSGGAVQVDVESMPAITGTVNPTTAANWGIYVEDAAETAGGNLSMAGTVRRDAPVTSAGATGENATVNSSAEGGVWVSQVASVSGGSIPYRLLSAASTNATNIKASAGKVLGIQATNINAAPAYVILFNTAGAPTCTSIGTGTPTYLVPGATTGGGTNVAFTVGIDFATGIGMCITTAPAGTGAVAANEVIVNLQYK